MLAVAWCGGLAVVLALTINGTIMVVSPRRWFRLPAWLRTTGTLTERQYASGWGAIQVRVMGAILLGMMAYVVWDLLAAR